jgi:phage I-like protein
MEIGFIDQIIETKKSENMAKDKMFANLTDDEQAEMDALKAEIEKLKGELAEYQSKVSAMTEEKEDEEVEAVVTNAIKSGKFLAEKKKELVAMAKSNLPAFKAMVEAVPANLQKTEFTPRQPQGVDKKQLWEDFKAGKIDSKQYSNSINQKQIII